jgi:hypothetical protein
MNMHNPLSTLKINIWVFNEELQDAVDIIATTPFQIQPIRRIYFLS